MTEYEDTKFSFAWCCECPQVTALTSMIGVPAERRGHRTSLVHELCRTLAQQRGGVTVGGPLWIFLWSYWPLLYVSKRAFRKFRYLLLDYLTHISWKGIYGKIHIHISQKI